MNRRRTIALVWLAVASVAAAGLIWRVDWNCQYLASDGRIVQWRKTLKQISASLALARQEHKRVLLDFTAPHGCTWCILLNQSFESNLEIAAELRKDYLMVWVDVTGQDNLVSRKYGNPTRSGLPVAVILDSEGRQLVTQHIAFADQNALKRGIPRIDAGRVLAFLKGWAVGDGP